MTAITRVPACDAVVPSNVPPVIVVGGGQSGLAAAHALRELCVPALILEASGCPCGSWPHYYDSLHLFSPAAFSSLPRFPFPAPPDSYPSRDEVSSYLEGYAALIGADIQANARVDTIRQHGREFLVFASNGKPMRASGVVAASGSFSNPYRPGFDGQESFSGELLHVAEYRSPAPYTGKRVIVVGAGSSAAQVANELARVASVTLASRHPVRFIPQHLGGRDIHHWLRETGFDALPAEWLTKVTGERAIIDSVNFKQTLARGLVDRRPIFAALDGDEVVWSDGEREHADAIILATGYRPSLEYLRELGAIDERGTPLHTNGVSSTHPGLVYVGLDNQRSFASNTLRGVSADADAVAAPLAAWVRDAPRMIGISQNPLVAARTARSRRPNCCSPHARSRAARR